MPGGAFISIRVLMTTVVAAIAVTAALSPATAEESPCDAPEARAFDFRKMTMPEGERTIRIMFSDITRDSVRWELAVAGENSDDWSALWIMDMRRAEAGSAAGSDPDGA